MWKQPKYKNMNEVQNKIVTIVEDYKKLFSKEYEAVVQIVKDKNKNKTDKFSKVKGADMLERALFEISETLDNLFNVRLTPEENNYRKTKECARWFTKQYKEFSLTEN